jgi:hypothetical protein
LNRLGHYLGIATPDRFRNVNGVYMKLMNYRRFDPAFTQAGKVGLSRGGKAEEDVWNEFAGDPQRCCEVAETIRQVLASAQEDETVAEPAGDEIEEAEEGRVVTALHRRYERTPALVQAKKQRVLAKLGKLACEACGFDFQERYGERGEGPSSAITPARLRVQAGRQNEVGRPSSLVLQLPPNGSREAALVDDGAAGDELAQLAPAALQSAALPR